MGNLLDCDIGFFRLEHWASRTVGARGDCCAVRSIGIEVIAPLQSIRFEIL
jgi:hypothetical protein